MDLDGNQNQTGSESQNFLHSLGSFIWDLFKIFVIALVIIVPFRMYVAEPFVVSGSSMFPTYHDKDYLIIDRITYRRTEPQRGDVIVFRFPKQPKQYFIKRIIGLPGEKVKVEKGGVVVFNNEHPQGVRLTESYLPAQTETIGSPTLVTLGQGEYYVLGDNRGASSDSRVWGILPKKDFIGRVWVRVFPFDRFEFPKTPSYSF